jgi:hypothetical protein
MGMGSEELRHHETTGALELLRLDQANRRFQGSLRNTELLQLAPQECLPPWRILVHGFNVFC